MRKHFGTVPNNERQTQAGLASPGGLRKAEVYACDVIIHHDPAENQQSSSTLDRRWPGGRLGIAHL